MNSIMGPKKDAELYELVESLSNTVNALVKKIDDSTTDADIKKLSHSIASLTEEFCTLRDNNLEEINKSILHIKDTLISNVVESNKKLYQKLNDAEERILKLEKTVNTNSQRSRENNLEFHGIDGCIDDSELETVVKGICNKLNVKVKLNDIVGCHRLPARRNQDCKPTIVKFLNRKKAEDVMKNRKNLKDMNFVDLGLPPNTKLYANLNLSPCFKEIDFFCRKLKTEGVLSMVDSSNRHVKIKFGERFYKLNHINDLRELFQDREFISRSY